MSSISTAPEAVTERATWACPQCDTELSASRDYCPICTCQHSNEFSPFEILSGLLLLPIAIGGLLGGLFFLAIQAVETVKGAIQ